MTIINNPRRKLPYLHRNWITALNHWQTMGVKLSRTAQPGDNDDDYSHRPAKRRRCSTTTSPDGTLLNGAEQFYLPDEPRDCSRILRLEVLKIVHKDSSRVKFNSIFNGNVAPSVKDVQTMKARCRITVSYEKPDGLQQVLHCDSQICTVKTFKNPVGPSRMARIYLPQPFDVPEDKIFVERDDDAIFHLADNYTVVVELESAGDANWPPLNLGMSSRDDDIFSVRPTPPRQWVLSTEIPDVFDRSLRSTNLLLQKGPEHQCATDFVVGLDVRWSTGLSEKAMAKRLEKDVVSSITVFDQNETIPPAVNGYVNGVLPNGHLEMLSNGHTPELVEEIEEETGDVTPGGRRRRNAVKTYNLKTLSAIAQGKEPRKRRKMENLPKYVDDGRIVYSLPAEHIAVDYFSCAVCGAQNTSASQLKAHLMSHSGYDFQFEPRPFKNGFFVNVRYSLEDPGTSLRPRVYQLGRPLGPFDLDRYIEGDESWVTSRYGPDNDVPQQAVPVRKAPPKVTVSRKRDKRVVVPDISQPLYDPLSKAELKAGSQIRPHLADDTWLIQKHRDTLQDFFDVDPEEKEYMKEWDAFVMRRRICSDEYFPRAFLAFAKERGPWLVASQTRVEEFGKHMSTLIARGTLDEPTIIDAMARIAEARAQVKDSNKQAQEPRASPKDSQYRSARGCSVCGLPVLGPSLLLCANKECKRRLYHDDCIRSSAKMPVEEDPHWLCNICYTE